MTRHLGFSVWAALSAAALGWGCGASGGGTGSPGEIPAVPVAVAATAQSSTGVLVSWQSSAGAAAYKVQRASDVGGSPGSWGGSSIVAGSSFSDSGLSAGTTYWYRVAASNSAGDSAFSSAVSATTPSGASAPATPGNAAAIALSTSSIRVSWDPSPGATGYDVQRAPDAGGNPGSWGASAPVSASPFADSGLAAGTVYWYRVAASNSAGDSAFSGAVSARTLSGGGGTITTVPAALAALATKRVLFAHASVGANLLGGVRTILDGNGGAEPSIVDLGFPTPSAAGLAAGTIGEVGWYDLNTHPWRKVSAFQTYLNTNGLGAVADLALMKFCFVDFDAGADSVETVPRAQQLFADYQAMVAAVQAAHPGVRLVHFTAALTPAGNGRREAYSDLVRAAYGGTGRLFDLADLESNGHTDAQGRVLDPAYSLDGEGHLNATGQRVVAEALLLLLANVP
jgi:hypothetical protein